MSKTKKLDVSGMNFPKQPPADLDIFAEKIRDVLWLGDACSHRFSSVTDTTAELLHYCMLVLAMDFGADEATTELRAAEQLRAQQLRLGLGPSREEAVTQWLVDFFSQLLHRKETGRKHLLGYTKDAKT